jgi:hypothetical protein
MAGITLDELDKLVEKKYAPYDVDMGEAGVCRLLQSLRLPDEKQVELTRVQREFNALQEERIDEDGEKIERTPEEELELKPQMIDLLHQMFRLVAEDEEQIDKFLAARGDDLATMLTLFEEYADSSQMGEASASPSS